MILKVSFLFSYILDFLGPKFVVGFGTILSTNKFKTANPSSNYSPLSLMPFMRYYVLIKKVNPFIQLGGFCRYFY